QQPSLEYDRQERCARRHRREHASTKAGARERQAQRDRDPGAELAAAPAAERALGPLRGAAHPDHRMDRMGRLADEPLEEERTPEREQTRAQRRRERGAHRGLAPAGGRGATFLWSDTRVLLGWRQREGNPREAVNSKTPRSLVRRV